MFPNLNSLTTRRGGSDIRIKKRDDNLSTLIDESVTQFLYIYNFLNDKLIYYILDSTYTLTDEIALVLKVEIKPTSTSRMNESMAVNLEFFINLDINGLYLLDFKKARERKREWLTLRQEKLNFRKERSLLPALNNG